MAWRCSGSTNAELVDNLVRGSLLQTPRVIEAFKRVDRRFYVQDKYEAYRDSPSYIGYGATISAPHMHAHAVEILEPFLKPGANVLDVGSGSGYLCGIFHSLVQPGGTVLGIDHLDGLVTMARRNLMNDPSTAPALCDDQDSPVDPKVPNSKTMQVIKADGRMGAPKEFLPHGGWQAIHVGAAAPHLPQPLIDQLASPGRMFIPVGSALQAVWQIDKDAEGNVTKKKLFGVSYVPLTDAQEQYPENGSP
ncbi:hypothetical protein NBRC10512_007086 [Rhodotorula toruloides]|uniref:protein-L-isoaspartate(D-aspartate) O-methyltransferase n=2 Tax=Rhodotorula toruloides TaxID=5286 RepID=A0A061BMB2_RHOTO|nr:protein-L-isoaspartate (D-aspartate) O-methyltransferase [Rhodotorula toruloides NP11]EMS21017.1 protein-L-isoaspartate (D-aspartate) O-methyltransferase [Rhodotorula toruloides NP11]KAJ8294989.1 putative protein-L-isoaspartate O-methyltransferase [Rhodotorula toruloides]CDR48218.1 RHTO0S16e03796g1_1 [Rhodotorula toruloides]